MKGYPKMKKEQINIRDPFVVYENGKYYLYGTRAKDFGSQTDGFDVYVSDDLENFSDPIECFSSEKYGLNRNVNWAPEVHKYNGKYYMFATFTHENGMKGTHSLCSDSLLGPFLPNSLHRKIGNVWTVLYPLIRTAHRISFFAMNMYRFWTERFVT